MENYYFKHTSHFGDMFGIFENFYRSKTLSDVIISCHGRSIHAHRMVLCAGSDYFRKVLTNIKINNHLPILIIDEISYEDMEIILEFIYRGQIVVPRHKVDSLRQAAFRLKVKGFESFLRKPFCPTPPIVPSDDSRIRSTEMMKNGSIPYELLEERRLQNRMWSSDKPMKEDIFEKMLPFLKNRAEGAQKRKHQETTDNTRFRSPQLEAALQRGNNRNSLLKAKAGPSPLSFERNSPQALFDTNGTMNLKMDKSRQMTNGHYSAGSSMNDSCDENEDNQKNETVENAMGNGGHKDYDSEDEVQGVNYTYEMDPNSLMTTQWDMDDNNHGSSSSKDENEPMEDESPDYYDTVVSNPAASMIHKAALATMNGQSSFTGMSPNCPLNVNVFNCEHCPKFFYDEDHLQVHIKRTHGLNKMNQCDICGKAYAWKSGLYKHKRHVHGIGGPPAANQPTANGSANGKEAETAESGSPMSGSHPGTPASQPGEYLKPYSLEVLRAAAGMAEAEDDKHSEHSGSTPGSPMAEITPITETLSSSLPQAVASN